MSETKNTFLAFLRIIPAAIGALLGSLLSLVFFLMLQFAIQGGSEPASIAVVSSFFLFGVSFLSVLSSNVIASVFLALYTHETFNGKFREAISNIFFCNALVMACMSPFFLFLSIESAYQFSVFILPFLAISSSLLYNIFAQQKVLILAGYKAIVSGLLIAVAAILLLPTIIPYEMMSFFFLPVAWALIPLASVLVEKIYCFVRPS